MPAVAEGPAGIGREATFVTRCALASTPGFTAVMRRPDGRPLPDVPLARPLAVDPVATLRRVHAELGLEVHAWTATPLWAGERLDLNYALLALRGPSPGGIVAA